MSITSIHTERRDRKKVRKFSFDSSIRSESKAESNLLPLSKEAWQIPSLLQCFALLIFGKRIRELEVVLGTMKFRLVTEQQSPSVWMYSNEGAHSKRNSLKENITCFINQNLQFTAQLLRNEKWHYFDKQPFELQMSVNSFLLTYTILQNCAWLDN